MKNISIRVNDEIVEKLDDIAQREDRDRSYIINKAIKNYILREEYVIEQIHKGLKDIEEGRVHTEEEVFSFTKELRTKPRI